MRPTHIVLLLAVVLGACAPLGKIKEKKTGTLSIGVIGKEKNFLMVKDFQHIGNPNLNGPVALSVRELPFNKAGYRDYRAMKARQGEKPTFDYVDSLPVKPRYLLVEIKDKIALTTALNATDNKTVRSYLAKDPDCKIVTGISLYLEPGPASQLLASDNVFLITDRNGQLRIECSGNAKKQQLVLPVTEIFDYGTMGFCWGEDAYGHVRIQTLSPNGNCPNGTENNAVKLETAKSYLKI